MDFNTPKHLQNSRAHNDEANDISSKGHRVGFVGKLKQNGDVPLMFVNGDVFLFKPRHLEKMNTILNRHVFCEWVGKKHRLCSSCLECLELYFKGFEKDDFREIIGTKQLTHYIVV